MVFTARNRSTATVGEKVSALFHHPMFLVYIALILYRLMYFSNAEIGKLSPDSSGYIGWELSSALRMPAYPLRNYEKITFQSVTV